MVGFGTCGYYGDAVGFVLEMSLGASTRPSRVLVRWIYHSLGATSVESEHKTLPLIPTNPFK